MGALRHNLTLGEARDQTRCGPTVWFYSALPQGAPGKFLIQKIGSGVCFPQNCQKFSIRIKICIPGQNMLSYSPMEQELDFHAKMHGWPVGTPWMAPSSAQVGWFLVASDAPGRAICVDHVVCHGVPVFESVADVLQEENHEWMIHTGCHSGVHEWNGTVPCRTDILFFLGCVFP